MLNWIRRILNKGQEDARQSFFRLIDSLNSTEKGGEPTLVRKTLGTLNIPSGIIALGDPQYMPSLELPKITAHQITTSAELQKYPDGSEQLAKLFIEIEKSSSATDVRLIGTVAIDSAKLIVADKTDYDQHSTGTGKDRIGVISTAPDDTALKLLTKQFRLKTIRINPVCAHVVGPVSVELEQEIKAFLKSIPEYAQFPFFYFKVQTNNTFDRVNYCEDEWAFMRIGNDPAPLMFVCGTGRGDGTYDVEGEFVGNQLHRLKIEFM